MVSIYCKTSGPGHLRDARGPAAWEPPLLSFAAETG